jgi:putative oxidoreductase
MADLNALTSSVCPPARTRTEDLGLLTLRLTTGALLAGHGAQKLFGAFGGPGLDGMGAWLDSIGFRPGKRWALLAGVSEFGGGILNAVGLGGPLGGIGLQGAMVVAIRKAHWGKPIWIAEGGAEAPVLYSTIGLTLALTGPGRYSLDRVLGVRIPKAVTALAVAGVAAGIYMSEQVKPPAETGAAQVEQAAEDRAISSQPADQAARATEPVLTETPPPMVEEPQSAAGADGSA